MINSFDTHIIRSFKISCRGKGVLPSLKLSQNLVKFAATPLNSLSTARVAITNQRLGRLSSPVIRGAVLPQGAKSFEFWVPSGVPLEVSPRVGTVGLDEVRFIHTHTYTHTHTHDFKSY